MTTFLKDEVRYKVGRQDHTDEQYNSYRIAEGKRPCLVPGYMKRYSFSYMRLKRGQNTCGNIAGKTLFISLI
jgi:hypothetical protein